MEDQTYSIVPGTQPVSSQPSPTPTFLGNTYDVLAIIAAAIAGVVVFVCVTLAYGAYCLPVIPLILGMVALINASASVNPQRTRLWGWVSVGVGGVILLIVVAVILMAILFYGALFTSFFGNLPRQPQFR